MKKQIASDIEPNSSGADSSINRTVDSLEPHTASGPAPAAAAPRGRRPRDSSHDDSDEEDDTDAPASAAASKRRRTERSTSSTVSGADDAGPRLAASGDAGAYAFLLASQEVLKEVRPSKESIQQCETFLRDLKSALEALESAPANSCVGVNRLLEEHGLLAPEFSAPGDDREWEISFSAPPSEIKIVGSFLLRTLTRPGWNVDVSFVMPSSLFHERDFNHMRYLRKRAAYLLLLQKALRHESLFLPPPKQQQQQHLAEKTENGKGTRKSSSPPRSKSQASELDVRSKTQTSSAEPVETRIDFLAGDRLKPILVLTEPVHGFQVRLIPMHSADLFPLSKLVQRELWRVAEDQLFFDHFRFLHKAFSDSPALMDAASLLRVWARQRLLFQAPENLNAADERGCSSGFVLSMLAATICRSDASIAGANAYYLLRFFFKRVAEMSVADLSGLKDDTNAGVFPFLFRISQETLELFRAEAQASLLYMNDFDALFLKRVDLDLAVDGFIFLPAALCGASLEHLPSVRLQLQRALAGRCNSLRSMVSSSLSSPSEFPVRIAFCVEDPLEAFKQVVMGPSPAAEADRELATAFKEFWGPKAELRRFKDGAIRLCAVFDVSPRHRFGAIQKICRHVLKNDQVRVLVEPAVEVCAANAAASLQILAEFQKLQSTLLQVSSLPLEITAVLAADPRLRSTVAVSSDRGLQNPRPVIRVVVRMETSGRWPDDVAAIGRLKTALYLKLCRELSRPPFRGLFCRPSEKFCDISFGGDEDGGAGSGATFRLVIHHDRDIRLTAVVGDLQTAAAMELDLVHRVSHHMLINDFALQHVGYAECCQLMHRFLEAHHLARYVQHELVELLVAVCYTPAGAAPYSVPHSSHLGFLRCLQLLDEFDWGQHALVVDAALGRSEGSLQGKRAEQNKKLAMEVVFDGSGTCWTRDGPDAVILDHLKRACRRILARYRGLVQQDAAGDNSSWKASRVQYQSQVVENASMGDYDWVIHLAVPEASPSSAHAVFDPVGSLVDALRYRFDGIALFFEGLGGTMIGVKLVPTAFLAQDLRLSTARCMWPLSDESQAKTMEGPPQPVSRAVPNVFEILQDIQSMGDGMVSSVEVVQSVATRSSLWASRC